MTPLMSIEQRPFLLGITALRYSQQSVMEAKRVGLGGGTIGGECIFNSCD